MTFPFSHSKQIILSELHLSDKQILRNIEYGLKKVKATNISKNDNVISFRGGLLRFVMSSNILGPVSHGRIIVTRHQDKMSIDYDLNFKELLILSSIGVFGFLGPFGFTHISSDPEAPIYAYFLLLFFLFIGWLWLFGMNYLVTVFRFPTFIKRIVKRQIN